MKIVLLQPAFGKIYATPPLGLSYLSAVLKEKGYKNIVGIDLHIDDLSRLEQEVNDADLVGISVVSKLFPYVVELSKKIKNINPKIKICIGGPHVSLRPEDCIAPKTIDFIITGEGEISFSQLVDSLNNDQKLSEISGLWYKEDEIIKKNQSNEWVKDLDSLPFPDFSVFPPKNYSRMRFFPIANIITGRSCPNICTNCQPALRKIAGPFRKRSVKNVIEEIRLVKKKYKTMLFNFADPNFTGNRQWVLDFCREAKKEKIKWGAPGCIKDVDKEVLQAMKDSGCLLLSFGVESGNQRVLDNVIKKKFKVEYAKQVMRWASEVKLRTWCFFMIGMPGETREEIFDTIELAKTIDTNMVMFSVGVPQPDVEWTYKAEEMDWIIPHELSDLEKPGHYPYNIFGSDQWFGRTSLFQTDEWGPDFIEVIKQKIINDFDDMGWVRERGGFIFRNLEKEAKENFLETFSSEIFSFLNNLDVEHIKVTGKLIKMKIKPKTKK
jgi:radical SAM superfamily enzyme YgiQ (UPF0313 family)